MDAALPVIFLVIVVVIIAVSLRFAKKSRERRAAVLYQVAERFGGQVTPGGWASQPSLSFSHAGQPVQLTYYSTGGKNPTLYTRLFVDLGGIGPELKVHVYPEGFFSRVGKVLGSQDIQLGDPAFDEAFMIKGSDEAKVKLFLTEQVKNALRQLRHLSGADYVDVATDGPRLRIQKLSWLEAADLLGTFCELGLAVADGYLAAVGAAPARQAAAPRAPAACPVCAHPVEGSARTCSTCGADHHPECWQLNDGCGICGAG